MRPLVWLTRKFSLIRHVIGKSKEVIVKLRDLRITPHYNLCLRVQVRCESFRCGTLFTKIVIRPSLDSYQVIQSL